MGRREKLQESNSKSKPEDLLETLGDFTSKENWDKFFTIRGVDDSFEWYADWPELRHPLFSLLAGASPSHPSASTDESSASIPLPSQILIPGCGNSRLSEHLYDAGFKEITNIDFSKVVISDMLRRNVRERPGMRWRVMDMTQMQFADGTYDVILDKGGLDALMEPEHGAHLGNQYLSEVRRVVKAGGRFICFTLAESHVADLLFSKFRFGWKMNILAVPQKRSSKPNLWTFMVVAEKQSCTILQPIESLFSASLNGIQVSGLLEALERENQIRREYSIGSDILYSLEDLQLGAIGDLTELNPGHRLRMTLGAHGVSRFNYRAVLVDAREEFAPFSFHYGVFIVPKTRAHEWLFSSEEGQWMVVESSKAARLVIVILDSSHSSTSMDDIQKDLSPLVKQLAPGKGDNDAQIPFMMASDGIKQRKVVHQVTSALTGPVIIEDVVYDSADSVRHLLPSKDLIFRRLVFERTQGLVQSEALLARDESFFKLEESSKKSSSTVKSKKRGSQKPKNESNNSLVVYHDYLASSYHMGIISGFMLISSYMESVALSGKFVNAVVIGLGAGLLPMYLHRCVPFLHIEVVELDPVMFSLAKEYFGFFEDERMKVHIADGIKFVKESKTHSVANNDASNGISKSSRVESCIESPLDRGIPRIDILIIDVDSPDSCSGMTCPASDFVEESFLSTVKDTLSEQGVFILNLVSRSSAIKDMIISRMQLVFNHVYGLQLEKDVNMVLFALPSTSSIQQGDFTDAVSQFEKLLKFKHSEIREGIVDAARKIKRLK